MAQPQDSNQISSPNERDETPALQNQAQHGKLGTSHGGLTTTSLTASCTTRQNIDNHNAHDETPSSTTAGTSLSVAATSGTGRTSSNPRIGPRDQILASHSGVHHVNEDVRSSIDHLEDETGCPLNLFHARMNTAISKEATRPVQQDHASSSEEERTDAEVGSDMIIFVGLWAQHAEDLVEDVESSAAMIWEDLLLL